MKAKAVFLDRDGTIIEDQAHLGDPDGVRLYPEAAEALRRFSRFGHLVVVISNQSGIARGLFDEESLARVHARLEELLEKEGARIDGAYYCPFLDGEGAAVDAYRRDSDLRKPRPGMLQQAARDLNIDLSQSWMVGDSACDVEAGRRAGCRTIRVLRNRSPDAIAETDPSATCTVGDLSEAANILERAMTEDRDIHKESGEDGGPSARRSRDDEILGLLTKLSEQLDRAHRREHQQDFSMLRLSGALVQMIAIVAAIAGVSALFGDQPIPATARLTLACFLQLGALSAFAIDRFR